MALAEKLPTAKPRPRISPRSDNQRTTRPVWLYAAIVVVSLMLLAVFKGSNGYTVTIVLLTLAMFAALAWGVQATRADLFRLRVDRLDLIVMLGIFVGVVALYRVAFVVIQGQDMLLFAFFAAGLLVGVVGPVFYTVWGRGRSLKSLGLSAEDFPTVGALALLFAAIQFSVTFWGYDAWPGSKDIVTLLAMALMVGIFETIFFRGFVQGRLEAAFGTAPAVLGAAFLYGIYHVGYGMGLEETVFLGGLGVVYALAYATTNNFFIMWPLLTPLGSFFAQLEGGELVGRLPWAALLGFADVIAVMAVVLWLAQRHEKTLRMSPV